MHNNIQVMLPHSITQVLYVCTGSAQSTYYLPCTFNPCTFNYNPPVHLIINVFIFNYTVSSEYDKMKLLSKSLEL